MKIAVIGAGISGVASAACIKNIYPQHEVVVIAKEFTPHTTSNGAAGIWVPHLLGETPVELVKKYAEETYNYAIDLIRNDPNSAQAGVTTTHGFIVSRSERTDAPFWADILYDFMLLSSEDMKRFPDYIRSGYKFTTVFIEGAKYIPWQSKKFQRIGGKFISREIRCLDELSGEFDIVVNCSGLGAKQLVPDDKMVPIKGQVVRVKAPWVKEFIIAEDNGRFAHIFPNQDDVVLGGIAVSNDTNMDVDETVKARVLESCIELLPSLRYAEHVCDWVRLRPARGSLRLEKEDFIVNGVTKTLKVVHNYGHGESGITLHRGCALEVVRFVTECLDELNAFKAML